MDIIELIFLGFEDKEDDNRSLGFYLNQEEEYGIWVLKFEKEEDDTVPFQYNINDYFS